MSVRLVVLQLAAMLLAGSGALAQRAPVPPEVATVQAAIEAQCGGKASFKPGFQRVADFNGDGLPDYLLDYGAAECVGGEMVNPFCGSGGCTLDIFVSAADGYRQAYGDNVRDWSLATGRGRPVLLLGLHGSACGRAGFEPCRKRLRWDGDRFVAAPAR
ncbi:hypothetical protein [Bosea sp. (in: a-proteobacteria)]|uniref:hypothetical protein n=1 Tax=Bosea sp. (in: a-proteobacteria) TaxID=1871050 RepID=UPI002FCA92BC